MSQKIITIDGKINLAEVVHAADMHRLSIIDSLCEKGLTRDDAESFADFAITWISTSKNKAVDELSDELFARLHLTVAWERGVAAM